VSEIHDEAKGVAIAYACERAFAVERTHNGYLFWLWHLVVHDVLSNSLKYALPASLRWEPEVDLHRQLHGVSTGREQLRRDDV
jgi:hypothetical protein